LDYCQADDNDTSTKSDPTTPQLIKQQSRIITNTTTTNTSTTANNRTVSSTLSKYTTAPTKLKRNTVYKHGRPSSNTFFQVLEAWMEQSMIQAETSSSNATMECAEQARLLLTAMLPKRDMYQPHTSMIQYNNNSNKNNNKYNNNKIGGRNLNATSSIPRLHNTKMVFLQNLVQTSHYEVVLQAYAVSNAGLPAAIRAESLLLQMIQKCRVHIHQTTPKRRTTSDSTSSSSSPSSNQNNTDAPPNRVSPAYNSNNRSNRPAQPTIKTFNIVLNCWAKSNAHEAADRITALVTFMEQWHETCRSYNMRHVQNNPKSRSLPLYDDECLPNVRSLLCLIEAWTNGRPNEAPEVTLRILQEVMIATDQYRENNPSVKSIRDQSDTNNSHSSITHMDGRYQNVQLDEAIFNAVIYAWVRSNRGRSAAIQAEEILQMMIQWSQVSSNNSKSNRSVPVQPTTRTYSMIIMAWAECETIENRGDAAQRAETILMKMVQLFSQGQDNVKPNSLLFTSCIAAWSRAASNCHDAPDRAERLWELLRNLYAETGSKDIELEPTTQIGNAVISAWSRCTSRLDSVQRALGALELLKQESKDDLISYNTVLDAMSKKGCAQDAMKLLQWLESQGQHSDRSLVPDLVSYNSVLAAFGRSSTTTLTSDDDKSSIPCCVADEAERLLRRMEQMNHIKPDKLSYTCKSNVMFAVKVGEILLELDEKSQL
jgi:hypothetical protein